MLGKPVADFSLPSTGGTTFKLSGTRGSKLVLYFYPKDNTPGCTQQGSDFRDLPMPRSARPAAQVYGISRDSLKSHESFKAKMKFPFELLSDADEAVCGAVRRDEDEEHVREKGPRHRAQHLRHRRKGVLAREWRGVKVPGHVQEVLNFVKAL